MNFVVVVVGFFFFKQKTAYEMRISDWSSDVCSSDLRIADLLAGLGLPAATAQRRPLHMLMIDNAPGPLWAHCFDASDKPRVTITTHRRGDGEVPEAVREPAQSEIGRAHV